MALFGVHASKAQTGYGSTSALDRVSKLPKDKHVFVLRPNEYWYKQDWADSVYAFPEFLPGKMEFTNGFTPNNRMFLNYNVFLQKFVIREDNGDVVGLDYSKEIKYIWVGDHKFIYSPPFGYLEIILEGKASVAESTFMRVIYELGTVNRYPSSVYDDRTAISKTPRYYWQEKAYYVFSDPSHMHRSSPAALPKIFPRQKSKIHSFQKEHHNDYKKRDDLLEIVSYCNNEL